MRKILIMTASAGGGHNSAARAMKDALDRLDCDTMIVDALKFVSPILDRIVSGGYETSAKYIPQTYGSIYKLSGAKTRKHNLDVLIRQVMGKKIFQLIQTRKPDAVVCTHPFPTMALQKYKEQGVVNVPIISILTDYTAHPAYVQKNADAFIIGDEDVAYLLKSAGIPAQKIYPFGIPVSDDFLKTDRVETVKNQLQLEDKFTILLMGGSFGAGNLKECLIELLNSRHDFQVVVITGRDQSLKERLEKLISDLNTRKTIRILGFTKDMPELLTLGNVLVTKPGGLTTTEAILKGIPMIIPYYIPGQEAENVDFLLNNGLALKTSKNYSLTTLVEILIENPYRTQEMADRMMRRRKLGSATRTAELVVSLIEEREKNQNQQ